MPPKPVAVAGPPTRAASPPRHGYTWALPLTAKPPTEWVDRFAVLDWPALLPDLDRVHLPRLDRRQIWLPALRGERLTSTLTVIADQVDEITRILETERQAAALDAQRDPQRLEHEIAEDDAAIAAWWAQRRQGRDG